MELEKKCSVLLGNSLCNIYHSNSICNNTTETACTTYHIHYCWELHFLFSGNNSFLFDNKIHKLSAGNLLLIKPGTKHMTYLDNNNYERASFRFRLQDVPYPDSSDRLLSILLQWAHGQVFTASQELAQCLAKAWYLPSEETSLTPYQEQLLYHKIFLLLFEELFSKAETSENWKELIGEETTKTTTSFQCKNIDDDLLNSLVEMVYSYQIYITDIADSLNYSTRTVERMIRQVFGTSLREIRKKELSLTMKELQNNPELDKSYLIKHLVDLNKYSLQDESQEETEDISNGG